MLALDSRSFCVLTGQRARGVTPRTFCILWAYQHREEFHTPRWSAKRGPPSRPALVRATGRPHCTSTSSSSTGTTMVSARFVPPPTPPSAQLTLPCTHELNVRPAGKVGPLDTYRGFRDIGFGVLLSLYAAIVIPLAMGWLTNDRLVSLRVCAACVHARVRVVRVSCMRAA